MFLLLQVGSSVLLFGQVKPLNLESTTHAAIIIDPVNPPACCDPKFVKINVSPAYGLTFNSSNSLTLSQNISISTTPVNLIKSIKAEISYFEFLPENENCLVCNQNSATFGNFNSGTAALVNGTGSGTHALLFSFTPSKPPGTIPFSFLVSLPPTVGCCNEIVRFCIRYTIAFENCSVCTRTVCYERKNSGGAVIGNPNDNSGKN